jgi:hypothetical protein
MKAAVARMVRNVIRDRPSPDYTEFIIGAGRGPDPLGAVGAAIAPCPRTDPYLRTFPHMAPTSGA